MARKPITLRHVQAALRAADVLAAMGACVRYGSMRNVGPHGPDIKR